MAGASLLALLDDITTILDDVALLTKVAAKQTAGVIGDDLALNAQQVAGVKAERELPVVWAVACGSLVNKAILVPTALAISALAPVAITPLLMIGGAYLCFEGFEKVIHVLAHWRHPEEPQEIAVARAIDPDGDGIPGETAEATLNQAITLARQPEKEKIKGAIRTDFVLSAEIVTIALGAVATATFWTQVLTLSAIGILMTVGVYGVVALIVKADDFGVYLCTVGAKGHVRRSIGRAILQLAPRFLKFLSFVGTLAMFLVGGGIIAHGIPWMHHIDHWVSMPLESLGVVGRGLGTAMSGLIVGVGVGLLAWGAVEIIGAVRAKVRG